MCERSEAVDPADRRPPGASGVRGRRRTARLGSGSVGDPGGAGARPAGPDRAGRRRVRRAGNTGENDLNAGRAQRHGGRRPHQPRTRPPLGRRRRGDGGGIRVHRSGARPGHRHPDLPRAHGARRAARGGAGCPGRARREPRCRRAGAGRHRARRRGHRVARRAGRDRRRVPGGGVGRVHRGSARGSRRHQPDAPARLCRGMSRESTPTTPGRGTVPVATPGWGRSGDATVVTDSDANQRLAAGIRTGGVEGASEQFPHRGLRG